VQQLWVDKAKRLNIPLSAKGHAVGQSGSFTGVGIDSFRGRFTMLPDKLASLGTSLEELVASESTTPRLVARVRGKALHYGCAIRYIAVAAASLSQLMHCRETGVCPVSVPSLASETDMAFDWDEPIVVTARARVALDYLRSAIDQFGTMGQPLWPIIPSSFYGAFLAGDAGEAKPLIITYDASLLGWGGILRTSPADHGFKVVGGFRLAATLVGPAYLEPANLLECPASQVYRETLAGYLVTRAASQHFALADHTVLIRGDCTGALAALRKGSFKSPALQDIAILHNRLLMSVGAAPPLYLHAPGTVMKAEGVDDLSRDVAAGRRDSESLSALRAVVRAEAAHFDSPISLDLFAAAENTLVPRFFARYPEPAAEAADALAQPDWGRSLCPHCSRWHRETVFAFPPLPLLASTLAKARADGARGVFVVPFTPSHPTWPVLEAASLSQVAGQLNRCVILPNSATYVSPGGSIDGTQRLAVLAVDFGPRSTRSLAGLTDPCKRAGELRHREPRHSVQDAADRERIAAALLRHGLASRDNRSPSGPAAGPIRPPGRGTTRTSPY
jgi:hypothetical protein